MSRYQTSSLRRSVNPVAVYHIFPNWRLVCETASTVYHLSSRSEFILQLERHLYTAVRIMRLCLLYIVPHFASGFRRESLGRRTRQTSVSSLTLSTCYEMRDIAQRGITWLPPLLVLGRRSGSRIGFGEVSFRESCPLSIINVPSPSERYVLEILRGI